MNSLANKLYYMSYVQGDTKLKGTVEIAEGLTSSSVSASGDIAFRTDTAADKNGQGTYVYEPEEPFGRADHQRQTAERRNYGHC